MVENEEIFSRCSPSRVYSLINGLTSVKKEVIMEMGFGSLLGMKKCNLRRELIHWLIEKFDPVDGSLNLPSRKIIVNSMIFANTLGVVDGGEDVGDLSMDDSCKRVNGEVRRKLSEVEETLKNNVDDDLFVNNFAIFVCGTLLLPTTSLYVVRKLEESLKKIKTAKNARMKNWASSSWRFLVEGIRRYKERRPQFVSGCVYFLQLYYLNELEGHDRYVDKSICPTNWWTEKEMKCIFAWINDCGGFDKVIVNGKGNDKASISCQLEERANTTPMIVEKLFTEFGVVKSQIDLLRGDLEENIYHQMKRICNEVIAGVTEVVDSSRFGTTITVHRRELGTSIINHDISDNYITREPSQDVCHPLQLTTDNYTSRNPSIRKSFEKYIDSGGMVVGPFTLTESVDFNYFTWAVHIFNEEFSLSEVLFRHRKYEVVRLYFSGLLPNCKIDLQLIGAYVLMIRWQELMKFNVGRSCCFVTLPIRKRNGSLIGVDNIVEEDYAIPLRCCAKVILPILDFDDDHWILAEFNAVDNVCGIWDSLGVGGYDPSRWNILKDLAYVLDSTSKWKSETCSSNMKLFSSMKYTNFSMIPLQENSTDCGVFIMKFIEASTSMMQRQIPKFNPSYERLKIGVKIISSHANDVSGEIFSVARANLGSLLTPPNEAPDIVRPTTRVDNPKLTPTHPLLATKKKRKIFWQRCQNK